MIYYILYIIWNIPIGLFGMKYGLYMDEKLTRDPILPWGPSAGCVGLGRINSP